MVLAVEYIYIHLFAENVTDVGPIDGPTHRPKNRTTDGPTETVLLGRKVEFVRSSEGPLGGCGYEGPGR